jgi:hypothetical protein
MATKGSNQKNRKADPNKTKTGKTRLGPLNLPQLLNLLEKSGKAKERAKIRNAIRIKNPTHSFEVPVVEEVQPA